MCPSARRTLPGIARAAIAFALIQVNAQLLHARAPKGSDKLTPAAIADSLAVLQELEQTVRADPTDAAAWHRRGMVAWVLRERDRFEPLVAGLDDTPAGNYQLTVEVTERGSGRTTSRVMRLEVRER